MEKCDRRAGGHQVNRDAVGDGDREEDAGCGGDPPIDPFQVNPPSPGLEGCDLDAVHLIPKGHGLEVAHVPAESQPAAHDFPNRLPAPEPEIEASARLVAAAGNPGDDAKPFLPAGDFESRHWSGNGDLPDL